MGTMPVRSTVALFAGAKPHRFYVPLWKADYARFTRG